MDGIGKGRGGWDREGREMREGREVEMERGGKGGDEKRRERWR